MRLLRQRLARTLTLLAFCCAGLAAALLAGHAREGAFAGARAQAFVTGALAVEDSLDGGAILRTDALRPGGSVSGTVTIRNTGTLPGELSLASSLPEPPDARGRDLLAAAALTVTDTDAPPDAPAVYRGRLDEVATATLLTLAPGAARTYRLTVALPDGGEDNRLQRAGVIVVFAWTLTAPDGTPTTGTTTPPPTTTVPPVSTGEQEPAPAAPPSDPPAEPPAAGTTPAPAPPQPAAPAADRPCARLIRGTARPDRLLGGSRGDRLLGRGGSDRLLGGSGPDCLSGGTGGDHLSGGRGADVLEGGSGADLLTGGSGRDRLLGGTGSDRLWARDGEADLVDCGPGHDVAVVDRRDRVRHCERVRRTALTPRPGAAQAPARTGRPK